MAAFQPGAKRMNKAGFIVSLAVAAAGISPAVYADIIPTSSLNASGSGFLADPNDMNLSGWHGTWQSFYTSASLDGQSEVQHHLQNLDTENKYDASYDFSVSPDRSSLDFNFAWDITNSDNTAHWQEIYYSSYWGTTVYDYYRSSYASVGGNFMFTLDNQTGYEINISDLTAGLPNGSRNSVYLYEIVPVNSYSSQWTLVESLQNGGSGLGVLDAGVYQINFHAQVGQYQHSPLPSGNSTGFGSFSLNEIPSASVPEPLTLTMMISGIIGISGLTLRRRRLMRRN
jgi:hypothetical protein